MDTSNSRKPNEQPVRYVPQHSHGEAFCLMKYQSRDGRTSETLWNSRDGVTPFGLAGDLYHVDWRSDVYAPFYLPPVGSRIFVDATPELVWPAVIKYVEENWDRPEYPIRDFRDTKSEAIEFFVDEWAYHTDVRDGATKYPRPWVLTVTPEIHDQFKRHYAQRPFAPETTPLLLSRRGDQL